MLPLPLSPRTLAGALFTAFSASSPMTTIYDLRCKMIGLVHAGLIDRKEYDSLFEVLCEAKNLLPQHADDVHRAVQLIEKLLPAPPTGGRVYVVGEPNTVGLALAHAAHVQEQLRPVVPPVEFVGLAIGPAPKHYMGEMHLPVSPEYLARCSSLFSPGQIHSDALATLPKLTAEDIMGKPLKLPKLPKKAPFMGYYDGRKARKG
jgi:hypothetical protein